MKIVHVVYSLNFGGIETMLVNIVNEQIKYENKITIVVINSPINQGLRDAIDKRVNFIELGRVRYSKNPYYVFKLNKIL